MTASTYSKYMTTSATRAEYGSVLASRYQFRQNTYIRNCSGVNIAVLSPDGDITMVPSMNPVSTLAYSHHQRPYVEVSWQRNDGRFDTFDPSRKRELLRMPKDPEQQKPNTFNATIAAEEIVKDVVCVDELGIYISSVDNIQKLESFRRTDTGYTERLLEAIARKYFTHEGRSAIEDSLMRVPTAPVVVFANCHDINIKKLYIGVNNIPTAVEVCHIPEMAETLQLAICRADGIVTRKIVENFQWSKSTLFSVNAFDFDWVIGTSKADVSQKCIDIAINQSRMKDEKEVNNLIRLRTVQLEDKIKHLEEDIANLMEANKRLSEQNKELAARLKAAESYTENTVKQQMAYDNMHANREKMEFEREKMNFDRVRADWEANVEATKAAFSHQRSMEKAEMERRIAAERAEMERQITAEKAERDRQLAEIKAVHEREQAERTRREAEFKAKMDAEAAQRKAEYEERMRRLEESEARLKAEADARKTEREGIFDNIKTGLAIVASTAAVVVGVMKLLKR